MSSLVFTCQTATGDDAELLGHTPHRQCPESAAVENLDCDVNDPLAGHRRLATPAALRAQPYIRRFSAPFTGFWHPIDLLDSSPGPGVLLG